MNLLSPNFFNQHYFKLKNAVFLLGVAGLIVTSFTGQQANIIVGDAKYYFEYARSFVVEGGCPQEVISYPCGAALLGLPGYFLSFGVSQITDSLGWSTPNPEGWGIINQLGYSFSLIALCYLSLILNFKMLKLLNFPDSAIKITLLFWVVGTHIGFYFFKEPAMSEAPTYFTLSLFYWLLLTLSQKQETRWFHWVFLGSSLGLSFIVRQQNIVHSLALIFLLWPLLSKENGFREVMSKCLKVMLGAFPIMVIPYLVWYAGTGEFQLSYYGERSTFNFLNPHFWDVFFTYKYHGLFPWNPLFLFAAFGMILFFRRFPQFLLSFALVIGVQVVLIASWYCWWFGDGLGNRGFFTIYPILLLGMASISERLLQQRPSFFLLSCWVLTFYNVTLMVLVSLKKLPTNPEIWESWGWPNV